MIVKPQYMHINCDMFRPSMKLIVVSASHLDAISWPYSLGQTGNLSVKSCTCLYSLHAWHYYNILCTYIALMGAQVVFCITIMIGW